MACQAHHEDQIGMNEPKLQFQLQHPNSLSELLQQKSILGYMLRTGHGAVGRCIGPKCQQVREIPGKLGSGLVVFVWLVGGVPSRGLLTGRPRDWNPPPLYTPPPPLLVATAGKDGCSEAGPGGPIPWCSRSRCWWLLESGNTTRPDPTFPGTFRTC